MNNKIQKSILAGIIGTVVMTIVMMVAPIMGMPKMLPPKMLSDMLGMPDFVGWLIHFTIGLMLAFAYTYLCIFKHKIGNVWLKGAVFGIIAFVFAQIMMAIMGAMMPMPKMEDPMMLTWVGSLTGHIIFGIAVSKIVGNTYCAGKILCNKNDLKMDCKTDACRRVMPQFRLTWCNIKTIIMLGLAIYFWLMSK